jgi:phosphoribosylaminoimidazole-succinocarboxamide synthase
MKKIELLSSGKAKSLYTTENSDQLIMEYRDDTSAFDGKKNRKTCWQGNCK